MQEREENLCGRGEREGKRRRAKKNENKNVGSSNVRRGGGGGRCETTIMKWKQEEEEEGRGGERVDRKSLLQNRQITVIKFKVSRFKLLLTSTTKGVPGKVWKAEFVGRAWLR